MWSQVNEVEEWRSKALFQLSKMGHQLTRSNRANHAQHDCEATCCSYKSKNAPQVRCYTSQQVSKSRPLTIAYRPDLRTMQMANGLLGFLLFESGIVKWRLRDSKQRQG